MSVLEGVLAGFRVDAISERDKGTDFEQLVLVYLRHEPFYQDLYEKVWTYGEWAALQGYTSKDTGIDLVAETATGEFHAIQCKNYAPKYKIAKSDIDSFFTASGRRDFSHRVIVTTTNDWTDNALAALDNQHPPVSVINLADLERSQIEWQDYIANEAVVLKPQKQLRPHQVSALEGVIEGLKEADRGKMIMACGTGKTFTSLRIAEKTAGAGKTVLFLVPSLALLSQTLTEWTQESHTPLHNFAVCSDSEVGKKRNTDDDRIQTTLSDLQYPATTNAKRLAEQVLARHDSGHMTVVYATYHSIDVISKAQLEYGMGEFDLVICDEAHRTTGATFDGDDESAFVRIHNNDYVQAAKRLYMTATPRIYGEQAKNTKDVELYSMDNEAFYGKELYVINFSEAVSRGLLVDYKVIVLAVEETHINKQLQNLLRSDDNQLKVDDAAKIIGCWKALSKQGLTVVGDEKPMQRAVAFCQVIEKEYRGKNHKVSSKMISEMFGAVVHEYQKMERAYQEEDVFEPVIDDALTMVCEAEHVDGSMNAGEKEAKLSWLKDEPADNHCRILTNVRCLSEGVDVPSLDAVLFLTPRGSQVDVVQSVGRVMRLAPGKKQGYVILPVVIPAGVSPEQAMEDNKTYRVVWQVLNALRSHDDRFDAMINKLEFNGRDTSKMEVIAVTDKVQKRQAKNTTNQAVKKARRGSAIGTAEPTGQQQEIEFEIGEIERALYATIVKKCGNRHHWEDWANDIAKIANTHIDLINHILADKENVKERAAFDAFALEIRDDLNGAISDDEIIEMLAQHLITKPVFDALFDSYRFTEHNPMSKAMQTVLETLQEHHIDKEADTLKSFYESVKMRAEGVESAEGKQRIIVELYDKFFRNAFPRMTDRLGIVYTPVEVVDFIIHSVEDVMRSEFGSSLANENVHIIDPFTGTGTFITRLLQSGIIPHDKLAHKYKNEIHANEIVLLAYYIAAINIEATYHGILSGNVTGQEADEEVEDIPYVPFEGICLTDTFQMYEKEDLVDALLEENSARRKRQKELDIKVIMGNPPYSAGQSSANDNNANIGYPQLDERIRSTYAAHSTAINKNALYDSYIRAIRWASDRIGEQGIVAYVTNAGFIQANTADGLRQCLVEEYSSLYVFHLRGNQRTSGERSRREGGKIFDSGSRAPIAISVLVKNPAKSEHGKIYFHDIGDYLNRTEKLEIIDEFASLDGITKAKGWTEIVPDDFNDWLNQRDPNFDNYLSLGDKRDKTGVTVFENYSNGLKTNCDAWTYNSSALSVDSNMHTFIDFYKKEVERYRQSDRQTTASQFIHYDNSKISWHSGIIPKVQRGAFEPFDREKKVIALYRPFYKQWSYYCSFYNQRVARLPDIFPNNDAKNLVICLTLSGTKGFSLLISDLLPDLHVIGDAQCFPLYLYEKTEAISHDNDLFSNSEPVAPQEDYTRRDAITDASLTHFQAAYPNNQLTKEDLFYYIYGLLHSEEYREKYADNLMKQLPRIPRVKTFDDFEHFMQAGRQLAELHLNYETVEKYPVIFTGKLKHKNNDFVDAAPEDFYVTKMRHPKVRCPDTNKNIDDLTRITYNGKITLEGIPLEAYDYVVNGKPAIAWVMERQGVSEHKASGIVNDANDWAIETMNNPRYSLELLQRVITVSLETMKIVNDLPKLDTLPD